MSKTLVPTAGLLAILVVAPALIFVVTLRPWAGPDQSWNTHLNFQETVPSDYTRTEITWTDTGAGAPSGWTLAGSAEPAGFSLYVARGCASCHGLEGQGGAVGPQLLEASRSEIRREARDGPEGMPEYHELDLSAEDLALIVDYLLSIEAVEPDGPTPTASELITPTPTIPPTASPTQELEITPSPDGTSSPATPSPIVTPPSITPVPDEPSPTPPAQREPVTLTAAVASIP